jgi:hypothetical protein
MTISQQEARDLMRVLLLAARGDYDGAISLCRKWIAIFRGFGGHNRIAGSWLSQGYQRILRNGGRNAEVAEIGARLTAIRTRYALLDWSRRS